MPLLELDALEKRWPSLLVRTSMSVEDGKRLAIVGPSGCGKSTLLGMIAGLETPDAGSVRMGGVDITALSPRERGIGMVFQDYALFPHLNAGDNVSYGLAVRRVPRKERRAEAARLLGSVGLSGYSNRRVQELSGGEKQRVALARTLALRPRLVLFDEPLSSLDAALRKRLRTDIREEQLAFGLTALYVTHDLEEAMAMADGLALMDGGAILQCGDPRSLWERPASARVARFMGSGPCVKISGIERRGSAILLRTDAGVFPLPKGQEALLEGFDPAGYKEDRYVFFNRSAALPEIGRAHV